MCIDNGNNAVSGKIYKKICESGLRVGMKVYFRLLNEVDASSPHHQAFYQYRKYL